MDSTHIVEFSERNDIHIASSAAANVPHSKCRSLAPSRIDLLTAEVDKKMRPSVISSPLSEDSNQQMDDETEHFNELWMLRRVLSSKGQLLPTFSDTNWSVG